ncbi:MAG: hypothetical protein A3F46_03860 [Legionellales bacterium RIFCSPHIGHO2_12_FULL_42_9]|nr:MAG: hypothetical protein A3F46_03860 [Legionellales bacterium RIFCSPHIGHO2_12_FULL_42_9]
MTTTAFRPPIAITFATIEQERNRFLAYCRDFHDELVVIDLEKVEQCDSAGLAFLIEAKRISKEQGRLAKIINMPQETRALAKFYGISDFL